MFTIYVEFNNYPLIKCKCHIYFAIYLVGLGENFIPDAINIKLLLSNLFSYNKAINLYLMGKERDLHKQYKKKWFDGSYKDDWKALRKLK